MGWQTPTPDDRTDMPPAGGRTPLPASVEIRIYAYELALSALHPMLVDGVSVPDDVIAQASRVEHYLRAGALPPDVKTMAVDMPEPTRGDEDEIQP